MMRLYSMFRLFFNIILVFQNGSCFYSSNKIRSFNVGVPLELNESADAEKNSYIDSLVAQCKQCVTVSYDKHTNEGIGRDREGTWIDKRELQLLLTMLDDIRLSEVSKINQYLSSSPLCIHSPILQAPQFDLTFLHAPPSSTFPSRTLIAGTIIIYKNIYGRGHIRTFIKSREIKYEVVEDALMMRLGGPSRYFGSSENGPAAVLELALYPPRRIAEGLEHVGGFDKNDNLMKLEVSYDQVQPMFISAAEAKLLSESKDTYAKPHLSRTALETLRSKVGGLGTELSDLIRRVLATRQLPSETMNSLGLTHVKGILLYGPPGCGKTLIARELAKVLNAREPKIVNGPEIMDKYVGEAEKNIRNLFKEAEEEWASRGMESGLHVIVFDELDAIAKKRGSMTGDGSGVRDSVVNQLLVLLDGVKAMDNVLVIGLTNRKELLDSALLRPGRFEIHLEIKLPGKVGREEILNIILKPIVEGGHISPPTPEVAKEWVTQISRRTSGWSGADLTGLVRSAASFAILRHQAYQDAVRARAKGLQGLGELILRKRKVSLQWEDFERAFREISRPKNSKRLAIRENVKDILEKLQSKLSFSNNHNNKNEINLDDFELELEELDANNSRSTFDNMNGSTSKYILDSSWDNMDIDRREESDGVILDSYEMSDHQ